MAPVIVTFGVCSTSIISKFLLVKDPESGVEGVKGLRIYIYMEVIGGEECLDLGS
jgi:hypothetical protein